MNIRQRDFLAASRRAKTLRRHETYTEQRVWSVLRRLDGLPGRFRRQAPIGPYVVDFVCHALKLVVEIDGGVHRLPDVAARDALRDAQLRAQGYTILRIANREAQNLDHLAALVCGTADELLKHDRPLADDRSLLPLWGRRAASTGQG